MGRIRLMLDFVLTYFAIKGCDWPVMQARNKIREILVAFKGNRFTNEVNIFLWGNYIRDSYKLVKFLYSIVVDFRSLLKTISF